MSLLVLLDIPVAFDTIDHSILLGRLSVLGIGGVTLAWLRSFLEDRPQRVQLGEIVDSCRLSIVGFHVGQSSPQCFLISI